MMIESEEKRQHFIRQIIKEDLSEGKYSQIITRFPPEPNGYLHIGHAKSLCLNFGMAEEFQGRCNLRFDDTNPEKEETEFVNAIREDVKWLGFQCNDVFYSSDYYQQLYDFAVELIQLGKAYVDSLSLEEIRAYRGDWNTPGKESPYRNRGVDENLNLFARMKAGEFAEGQYVLRAKCDMQSGNINLRDPVMYRIRFAHHQRTGDTWCIYPMYDFAHPLSDGIEGVTHSLCSLEFQDHRPLYDWFIDNVSVGAKPIQTEFARLNISHTILSKRKLRQLVEQSHVDGWGDPRMPTLRGLRQRGYPAEAIKNFCEFIGVSRNDSVIDMSLLEEQVRNELNRHASRAMCVINPLKVVILNYPERQVESLSAPLHPQDDTKGTRCLPFSRELYIEQEDFMEDAPKKFFRLSPGKEVRLRNAYVIKCEEVIKDELGNVIELRCTYDLDTLGKKPEGRKVKGVIHWVSIAEAKNLEVTLYDRLFMVENPGAEDDFIKHLNPQSKTLIKTCYAEPHIAEAACGEVFQFERLGYFCINKQDGVGNEVSAHRVVSLKDTWAKKE